MTEDKDFGEPVFRLGLPARGILPLRLDPPGAREEWTRLGEMVAEGAGRPAGILTIVDPEEVRARPPRQTPRAG